MHSFQTLKAFGISCLNGFKFFIKRAFLVKFNLIFGYNSRLLSFSLKGKNAPLSL